MDRDTIVGMEYHIAAGDRLERAFWLMAGAKTLASGIVYSNNGKVQEYEAWEVAAMIAAAAGAAMDECTAVNEALDEVAMDRKHCESEEKTLKD